MRGFFEIGIYNVKNQLNIGTLWRSAFQLGASGIFVIGKRYKRQSSDTLETWKHIPLREFDSFDQFREARPYDCLLVGIEIRGVPLAEFKHPERAIYLLGAEDGGLPIPVIDKCQKVIEIESVRRESYNVAVAGAIVMYHRLVQQMR